jgi:hypothetical protein
MRLVIISIACLLMVPGLVSAQLLTNGDIETNVTAQFGGIAGWGPNGGWAAHSGFVRPNNGSLGLNFGFMSAGGTELVAQKTAQVFELGKTYTFAGWANPGGDGTGEIVYQIGYDDGTNTFVPLLTQAYNIDGTFPVPWASLAGVTYSTAAGGPEVGKTLWVRLGDGVAGAPGNSDVWFDNLSLTVTPEPASLVLLSLAAVGLFRRR